LYTEPRFTTRIIYKSRNWVFSEQFFSEAQYSQWWIAKKKIIRATFFTQVGDNGKNLTMKSKVSSWPIYANYVGAIGSLYLKKNSFLDISYCIFSKKLMKIVHSHDFYKSNFNYMILKMWIFHPSVCTWIRISMNHSHN